jgi:hypothetical protein
VTERAWITVLTARVRRAVSLASGRRWSSLAPGFLLCNAVIAVPEGLSRDAFDSGGASSLDIDAHDGRVTVTAEEAPWKHLLDELTEQTGIRFHDASAPRAPVTVSCMDMTVAQLLTCLWGGARMARYPAVPLGSAVSAWPAEVWLLGRPGALQPEDRIVTVHHSDPPLPTAHAEAAQHKRQHLAAILVEAKSTDADARLQALTTLAGSNDRTDPAAQAAFRAALSDDVADVRAQGVWALSKEGGPKAIEVLRDALRDRDATVRLMAVDSTKVDRERGMLLEQALADSDETVRTAAAVKIREIEHQSKEERRRLADARQH